MVSRLFSSPPFIAHYQLKHKSSNQEQLYRPIVTFHINASKVTHMFIEHIIKLGFLSLVYSVAAWDVINS